MKITGKCHCGALSFHALVDPTRVIVCHCQDCQTFSGAPFRAVVPAPVENVQITGTAKHYVKIATSGNRRIQAFCADCGTQLYSTEADGKSKLLNLRLGCIEERELLIPRVQIWGKSAMPWLASLASVPIHQEGLASPLMPRSESPSSTV